MKKKLIIAIFGAAREIRNEFSERLSRTLDPANCTVHDFEHAVKKAATTIFGLPSDIMAQHPEQWSDTKQYDKTITSLLRAVYKFGCDLDPGIWVDRVLEEISYYSSPTSPYSIIRDGRTKDELDIITERCPKECVLIGVLIKAPRNPFKEEDFDVVVKIDKRPENTLEGGVQDVASWVREVHIAASSS